MDTPDLGAFGKYVPGFDFLQNLLKQTAGGAAGAMPTLGHWVAPTFNVEDLDKRIQELKTVHFWLDQNAKALSATIQALEVQRMTLATLQGMNVQMGDLAEALKVKPVVEPAAPPASAAPQTASGTSAGEASATGSVGVDPMQWWGALTQQFQSIAEHAVKDLATHAAQVTQAAADAGVAATSAASNATQSAMPRNRRPAAPKAASAAQKAAPAKRPPVKRKTG